ncbi:unnamed protein product [Gongylonema pulchrum]|uniref:Uncharacterized protein n=1 Tax=Gongylonema pulchrum TaxID=637853 RepID=A0A183DAE4_9BILA|nr:unnamed protein product [Gongylonema pulchrum]
MQSRANRSDTQARRNLDVRPFNENRRRLILRNRGDRETRSIINSVIRDRADEPKIPSARRHIDRAIQCNCQEDLWAPEAGVLDQNNTQCLLQGSMAACDGADEFYCMALDVKQATQFQIS